MARGEPAHLTKMRDAANQLGLDRVRGNRYEGQVDGLRARLDLYRRGGGEGLPASEFPRITVWLLRPPAGGLRAHRWGSALGRRRTDRKMVLMDDGVDLAVIRTSSAEALDRLEADGRVELLTDLYRRLPSLNIGAKRLSARLEDFDDLASAVEALTKAAHLLSE
jgi:hypothetical protein